MFQCIEVITAKTIVGHYSEMTLANDPQATSLLFRNFHPVKSCIAHRKNNSTLCVKIFPQPFNLQDPSYHYQKWAAVEVTQQPEDNSLASLLIPAGLYALFLHRDRADNLETFHFIFDEWLPHSCYQQDQRPQFEVMPANYSPFDDNAQEWIYIPITSI